MNTKFLKIQIIDCYEMLSNILVMHQPYDNKNNNNFYRALSVVLKLSIMRYCNGGDSLHTCSNQ